MSDLKRLRRLALLAAMFILGAITVWGMYPPLVLAADDSSEENRMEWTKQLGISVTGDVATDPNGHIYHVVYADKYKTIELHKYDAQGVEQWAQILYQQSDSYLGALYSSVSANKNGDVFVCYGSEDQTAVSKYNAQGELIWTRELGKLSNKPYVAAGVRGDVYVVFSVLASSEVSLVKYNDMGVCEWTEKINSQSYEYPLGITVDPIGAVYICGVTSGTLDEETSSGGWCDLFIAKFAANGQKQWIREYGYGIYDYRMSVPGGIACDQAGNVYFTLGTFGSYLASGSTTRWMVVKYNMDGNWVWNAPLYKPQMGGPYPQIAVDDWGNIYTYGTYRTVSPATGEGEVQFYLNKFDAGGSQLLVKELGAKAGNVCATPQAIAIGENGSIILAGETADLFNGQPFTGKTLTAYLSGDKETLCDRNAFVVKFLGDVDTDGDGLLDRWETDGYRTDAGFIIDLPAMGADPKRKDIFVEADWLAGHQPSALAIDVVVRKFAEAPVTNVDGSTGISLHVDYGSNTVMDSQKKVNWGNLSRATEIRHVDGDALTFLGDLDASGEYLWEEFDAVKNANFDIARSAIFRYCIFGHGPAEKLCTFDDAGQVDTSSSGMSRGMPSSDFMVTLGFWGSNGPQEQAGTFMHELGHTLGLRHGGGDHVSFKPNYFSIMNYFYQTDGLTKNGKSGLMDYSRFGHVDDLDENHLDETRGVTASAGEDKLISQYGLKWSISGDEVLLSENQVAPINWNAQGGLDSDVAININMDHEKGILKGNFNDWENLSYKGGNVGMGVSNALLPSATSFTSVLTSDLDAKLGHPYRVAIKSPGNLAVDRGQGLTCKFTVTNAGDNPDSYTIEASSNRGWADLSGVPATLALDSGESSEIVIPVTIPADAETAQEDYITLTATSTNNPLKLDRKTSTLVVNKKATGDATGVLEKLDLSALNAQVFMPVICEDQMACWVKPTVGGQYIGIYSLTDKTMIKQIDYMEPLLPYERSKNPYVDDIDFNGDYVVWHLVSSGREVNKLLFADLTQNPVAITEIESGYPADMDGNKLAFFGAEGLYTLCTYDLSTKTLSKPPANTSYSSSDVIIENNRLFWRYSGPDWGSKYYMYDLQTDSQTELLNYPGSLSDHFDANANKLVYDGYHCELEVIDLDSKLSRQLRFKVDPDTGLCEINDINVNNTLVAFVDDQYNVWLGDLEAETFTQVTTDGAAKYENQYLNPKIYNNQLVFCKNGEVYVYTLVPPVTTPVTGLNSATAEDGKNIKITLVPDVPNTLTYYQWDAASPGGWSQYTDAIQAPEGTHRLFYFSQNRAGISEEVQSASFTVDTTAPVTAAATDPAEPDGNCGWFTKAPTVTLTSNDPQATIYYQWDAAVADGFATYTAPLTALIGEHTLYFYSVDQSGNQEEVKQGVFKVVDNADTIPSETTISVQPELPGADGWYSKAPEITLRTEDQAVIYYQWDSSELANFTRPVVPEHVLTGVTASSQPTPGWRMYLGAFNAPLGAHTLYYFSVDSAGNLENTKSSTFKTGSEIVIPPSANADLAAVSLGGVQYTPGFQADTLLYTANVDYATTQITVTPTAANNQATMLVNGSALSAGSAILHLNVGMNTIKILVTAQDGVTTKSYTFNITRSSSGGEGGSSGRGSSPTSTLTENIGIQINGLQQAGVAGVHTTSRDSMNVTTVTVDAGKLGQRLAKEGTHAVVAILAGAETDVVIGALNGQAIKNMEENMAFLQIRTGTASYTIPAQQFHIDQIAQQLGGNIALQDIQVEVEIAKPATETLKIVENAARQGQFSIVMPPLEFKIGCTSNNRTVEVNQFSVPVERLILIPDGVDPGQISTGVIIEPDGSVRHVPTKVITIDGKYYAQVKCFTNSVYALINRSKDFKDVEHHWSKQNVHEMGSRFIISGKSNDIFGPHDVITRAEFATIVTNALGLGRSPQDSKYSDVHPSDWFYAVVSAASDYHIIGGYPDGSFKPNQTITREEAMALVARAAALVGMDTSITEAGVQKELAKFKDGDRLSNWSKLSVAFCIQQNIVVGNQGRVEPDSKITRAQAAVIVMRMLLQAGLI